MKRSAAEEALVFRSVRRSCYAGLDSVALRMEVTRRIADFIPFDAHTFALTDPDTGLFIHGVAAGLPECLNSAWLEYLYPFGVAGEVIEMVRSGTLVTTTHSKIVDEVLRKEGLGHHMRSVLTQRSDPLGFACFLRGGNGADFTEREVSFMRRLAPHLARGLRSATLLDRGSGAGACDPVGDPAGERGPGVVILDARGRLGTRNEAAARYLEDLADVGRGADAVPYAVTSAAVRMVRRHAGGAGDEATSLAGEIRAVGRSGRWYTIRASLSEPDAAGDTATIVLIEAAGPAERALILTRLYGLTPREREVMAMAAKGRSNKQIAHELRISPYTVQEHFGNACEKAGVRSRKALLAKLFFDGYAERLLN